MASHAHQLKQRPDKSGVPMCSICTNLGQKSGVQGTMTREMHLFKPLDRSPLSTDIGHMTIGLGLYTDSRPLFGDSMLLSESCSRSCNSGSIRVSNEKQHIGGLFGPILNYRNPL